MTIRPEMQKAPGGHPGAVSSIELVTSFHAIGPADPAGLCDRNAVALKGVPPSGEAPWRAGGLAAPTLYLARARVCVQRQTWRLEQAVGPRTSVVSSFTIYP